jgi:Amidohydrolase family
MDKHTVVQGGHALTMHEHLGDFGRGDVVIEDGLIADVSARGDPSNPARAYRPTFEARDVLDFAALSGARAIGHGDVCDSLTVGKAADVVLIRGDAVNTGPVIDPVGMIVLSADTSTVDTVLVAGAIVKHRGALVGVDIPGLVARAEQARDRILRPAEWPAVST